VTFEDPVRLDIRSTRLSSQRFIDVYSRRCVRAAAYSKAINSLFIAGSRNAPPANQLRVFSRGP
jgi:hypothetical protein